MVSAQFESTRVHPRRRPVINTTLAPEESSSSKMQLKKGETFNTPTSPPSSDRDPVLNIRSLPRRSPTSLDAIAASEQRMASILERLTLDDQPEKKLSSADDMDEMQVESNPAVSASKPSNEDGYDLFPQAKKEEEQQQQQQQDQEHGHESDSGLGSSVSSRDSLADSSEKVNNELHLGQSAITTASTDFHQGSSPGRQLSYSACKQIERLILVPILKEPKLKPFHPLVRSVPTRIVNKQIVCLRDLEKILLWLAPKFSKSRSAYLAFSEFTIQCLHTSTSHLNARDQRLPADRPYTNGYFLDLVTQVRRYAAMIQANRQRVQAAQDSQAQSANKDEPSSLIGNASLKGGLSVDGRPVELVITTSDGKAMSMATGLPYNANAPGTFKRTIVLDEEVDEGVMRSMARRKKNAPPMDINQKCAHCEKVFKRPCDLTKHEKTHSRPWKCAEETCKYHQLGWPTEKERDRHMNDKHSDSPTIFRCLFEPCTYHSKRESNCKQHMEKAHGWVYIRSKHSSRTFGSKSKRSTSLQATSAQASPDTPSASTPASGPTDFSTPSVGPTPSPYEASAELPDEQPFNFADPPAPGLIPGEPFPSFFDTISLTDIAANGYTGINYEPYQTPGSFPGFGNSPQETPSLAGMTNDSGMDSLSGLENHSPMAMGSENDLYDLSLAQLHAQFSAGNPEDLIPTLNEYPIYQMQLPDAADGFNAGLKPMTEDQLMMNMGAVNFASAPAHVTGLSPGAQGSLMLYAPDSGMAGVNISSDFPFGLPMSQQQPVNDFTLYGEAVSQGQSPEQGYGQSEDMSMQ